MALTTIYKGSDEVIQITVTNGTDPIDLSTAEDITVTVFQRKEDIIQQWKLSLGEVTIVNAANGICKVNMERNNTSTLAEGRMFIEVDLTFENAAFEDGIAIEKDIVPLCDLQNSVT